MENMSFKLYNGKMHDKGALIDDQLLIFGSQNFYRSAWDTPSLAEYNMATDDPQAVADFKKEFEYNWGRGIPAEESMEIE
jgi:phosphatidylserine/phosphatidylglycerophosphate/cardiolipin synthase-like enzyme